MADIINYRTDNTLLSGTSGTDSIYNNGSRVTIEAGAGNDTVVNWGTESIIKVGAGNDSVQNSATLAVIDGEAGNDTLYNWGNEVTISGGDGNDYLYNTATLALIDGGDGTDSIYNWGEGVTIRAGDGNDYIYNNGSNNTVDAGAGNDSIVNWNPNVTINAGAGNDSIRNHASNVLIRAEGGKTQVINSGADLTVFGSTADDLISVSGSYDATLNGGGGRDTIIANYKAAELIQYSGGDLLIENYNYDDTISIGSGSVSDWSTDGGNLLFNISDGGTITLKSMTNHAITVADTNGLTTQVYSNGYSPLEVIKNFMKSIRYSPFTDTTNIFNDAIRACSGFNTIQEVINKMVSDCQSSTSTLDFLQNYCGIILDNGDTGAITGWDAGGLTAKDADNVISETLPAETLSSLTNATYTKGGLTFHYPQNERTLTTDEKRILQGTYSWWAEASAKLIEESYGLTFEDVEIDFYAVNIGSEKYWGFTSGNQYSNSVSINAYYTEFDGDDDYDANDVDRCVAHELTHVAQNLYLKYFPQFLNEGMAELTGGIDDMRSYTMSQVASSASNLRTYLNLNNFNTGNSSYYAAGYMFWRYLAKQASDAYDSLKAYAFSENKLLEGTSSSNMLTALGEGLTVDADAGNDTILAYGKNEMLIGGAGNDSIYLSSAADGTTVNGGAGNDTIDAQSTDGYRVYEFASDSGRDVLSGYGDNDTIHILNGTEYSTLRSGNYVFVNVGGIVSVMKASMINQSYFTGKIVCNTGKGIFIRVAAIGCIVTDSSHITNCYSNADLYANGTSHNTMVSGITAWLTDSVIEKCYVSGNIIGSNSTSYVYAGGINASGGSGYVKNCISILKKLDASGQNSYSDSIGNYSTKIDCTAMPFGKVKISTYTNHGWDFKNIWIADKSSYPLLRIFAKNTNSSDTSSIPSTTVAQNTEIQSSPIEQTRVGELPKAKALGLLAS